VVRLSTVLGCVDERDASLTPVEKGDSQPRRGNTWGSVLTNVARKGTLESKVMQAHEAQFCNESKLWSLVTNGSQMRVESSREGIGVSAR